MRFLGLPVTRSASQGVPDGSFFMNRNDLLHWFILGYGLEEQDGDLGRATSLSELWQGAKRVCGDCKKNELLDALYTLPREYGALIKLVSAGEGTHPVEFDRVRNTFDWPEYFLTDTFHIKVLHEGRVQYRRLSEQLEKTATV